MVRIEEGVRRFHRDGFTFQRPAALLVVYENRAAAISHRHIVNRFALGFQRHVACRHGKAKARLALPIGRVCLYDVLTAGPLLELILDTRAPGKHNGHLGARQIDAGGFAGVAVLVHDGAAGHGEVVQLLVISFQGHVVCGHFKGKGFAVFPVLRRLHKSRATGKPPAAEQVAFVRPRLRHGDFIACQRTVACHAIYKDGAFSAVHRQGVGRFAFCGQGHVACGHGKGQGSAVLPTPGQAYDVLAAGPLLELFDAAIGKRNLHFGTRLKETGVPVGNRRLHDDAAGHSYLILGNIAIAGIQPYIAFGHGKGKGIFGLPMARQIRWNCAAERPTLELLCSRVLRGRNGYLFTGIEAGIDDVVCLGGDAIRQGKGVKGGGFDAEIRLTRMITVACAMRMRFFRIACRGGIINTAHAIRRHILDRSHPAACAFVPDLHFWSIDKSGGGKIEKGFFVAYSSHRNTAALVHRQLFIGHLSAIGGNIHRAIAGDRSNALKGILTLALHRNITAGVIHGQAAVNCDSMRIAYVHTAACRNVGALCNCGLRCINRISGHGNGIAGVYVQVSAHSCALRVGDRHCAITGDVGVTDDRCIVSACTGHLNAAALGHAQAAAHSRAHKCSHARKKSKCILDLYRTIAGDHGIAACIIAKRIPMAACDRHAAIASGIVYIQAAQHHPVILGRQRDFAVAFLNFQGTGHAISAEGNVMHSGDHDRICDCCHIPMSADQLQIGPRIDRSQNCIAQQISILIAAQIKGHL